MNPRITTIGTPEQAPSPVDRYRRELTEVDEKIRLVSLELMAIPNYSCTHLTVNSMTMSDATNRLREKHPTAIAVGSPHNPAEIMLVKPNLHVVVQCELEYLYNRKLQLQKYIDKASL